MTLFQLINTVFLELCPIQLIHSPFCQSSLCPWVTDNAWPQQENSRNSALEEGPEHRQPKSEPISCLVWKTLPIPREKGDSLIVPGMDWDPLLVNAAVVPCSTSYTRISKGEKRNSKAPRQSFFWERRKPSHGKSPLVTTYFYLSLANSTYVSLFLWTPRAAEAGTIKADKVQRINACRVHWSWKARCVITRTWPAFKQYLLFHNFITENKSLVCFKGCWSPFVLFIRLQTRYLNICWHKMVYETNSQSVRTYRMIIIS